MSETREPMIAKSADSSAPGTRSRRRSSQPKVKPDAGPDATVDRILSYLDRDRYPTARQLAAEALEIFPDHPRVRRAWSLFENRGKARVLSQGPEPSAGEELDWLRHPPEWARGKWVALVGSEAVASGKTLAEVLGSIESRKFSRKPLVHHVEDVE